MNDPFKPKIKPVENTHWWRDTRPGPDAVHHGVYTPILRPTNHGKPREPDLCGPAFEPPKKPRSTV